MQIEKQRASELSMTQVKAEMIAKEAEGNFNAQKITADADFYTAQRGAEATLFSKQKEAEAMLYYKLKDAEGISAIYNAQAEGLNKLVGAFGGNNQALISYTMLEKGIYEKLADMTPIKPWVLFRTCLSLSSPCWTRLPTKPITNCLTGFLKRMARLLPPRAPLHQWRRSNQQY